MSRTSASPAGERASDCKQPGLLIPVIDRNRCEGKDACVRVCPYAVFELGRLTSEQRASLSLVGRIKGFFHGYEQAFVVRADQCHACGLCVSACPEKAIKLTRPAERDPGELAPPT